MSDVARIAADLGMRRANEVEPPPDTMHGVTGRAAAIRWTERRKDIFNALGPYSVSLVATDGPVSMTLQDPGGYVRRRVGHNRGVWPARLVNGAARRDAATTTWNKFPLAFFGTQFRLWCLRKTERDRLADALGDLLALKAEQAEKIGGAGRLEHGAVDIGYNADLAFLEIEMHGAGQMLGIRTWDDFALIRWFDSLSARFAAEQARRAEIRWSERWVVRRAMADLETE